MHPKISIVTPSFNQGDFIEETICSILDQEYPNLEYIIIDGGSTDQTVDIIKKYESKIHYWVSEKDRGQAHAIQKGFELATGDFVNWINSDDILEVGALQKLARMINDYPAIDFFCGNWFDIDVNGKVLRERKPKPNVQIKGVYEFPYAQPASFYRKSLLDQFGGVDESFEFTMDYDLFVQYAVFGRMKHVDFSIARFRVYEEAKSGLSSYQKIWRKDCFRVFSNLLRTINAHEEIDLARRFGIYVEETKIYNIEVSEDTRKTVLVAFPFFAARWAHHFYLTRQYELTNQIIKYVSEVSPEAYIEFDLAKIKWRSKLQINRFKHS